MTRLLAAWSPGEVRIVAIDAGGPVDAVIGRDSARHSVGEVWRARVTAIVPAMAGAFCDLGGVAGFLPDSAGARGRTVGEVFGVRITRAAQGGKGPRLAAAPMPPGPQGLVTPAPPALPRLAALHPGATIEVSAPALLPQAPGALLRPEVAAEVEAIFAGLAEPVVSLPRGGALRIHPTPALTAIDVDTGAATAGGGAQSRAQAGFNRALLPAMARAIRVRNLSGAIVVDFAGMPARRRGALVGPLAEALAADPLRPRLLGFTALGFAEILRPRVEPPLAELLAGPHAAGLAALRAALAAGCTRLRAAPDVAAALDADGPARAAFARAAGAPAAIASDPTLPSCRWSLDA